jgi:nuclear protein 1
MSETHFDEFEHYNFSEDNKLYSNHSGRLRTKKVYKIRSLSYSPLLFVSGL